MAKPSADAGGDLRQNDASSRFLSRIPEHTRRKAPHLREHFYGHFPSAPMVPATDNDLFAFDYDRSVLFRWHSTPPEFNSKQSNKGQM